MKKTDVLFVHSNFPGQFGFLAQHLKARGYRCAAIGSNTAQGVAGIPTARWASKRGSTPGIFNPATRAEADMIRGYAAADCALKLKEQGFSPKLVIGHPGWGETIFIPDVFPKARVITHGEYYYRSEGGDYGFDPEFGERTVQQDWRARAKNATLALALVDSHAIVCPTQFQASRLPRVFADKISIIHEGVDTQVAKKDPCAVFTLKSGKTLNAETPIITFVNRTLEPLRGFHIFMRALPKVLREVPTAEVLIIGEEGESGYGVKAPSEKTWKQFMLKELGSELDLGRVHFTGRIPHPQLLNAFSVSCAHVYFTYPFVLSWSMLEAMACECLVIGSATPPVMEVITHGANGLLSDFFDSGALSAHLIAACSEPEKFQHLRESARRTVLLQYDRAKVCLPAWQQLMQSELMAAGA